MNPLQKNRKYRVHYKTQILTKATEVIAPDGFSSIKFINQGNRDAIINTQIPCNCNDFPVVFENPPETEITMQFNIKFPAGNVAAFVEYNNKNILVIKTYYE